MQVRYLYEAEGNKKANNAKAVSFITMVVVIIMIIIINRKWQAKLLSSLTSYNQSVNEVVFQTYVYRDFYSYSVLFALLSPAYLLCYRNWSSIVRCYILWAHNWDEINQSKSHKRGAISEVEEWIIAFRVSSALRINFLSVSSSSLCRLNSFLVLGILVSSGVPANVYLYCTMFRCWQTSLFLNRCESC